MRKSNTQILEVSQEKRETRSPLFVNKNRVIVVLRMS